MLLVLLVFVCAISPATATAVLPLERAFPTSNGGVELSQLKARDRVRHGRMLQQQQSFSNGVVDFSVEGTYDPFLVGYKFICILLI